MENLSFKKPSYRNEIDGLRAIAVISVIINHFNKDAIPSGYLGVDIFFVISGYVITSSIVRRQEKNFYRYISGFYERRIKRLIPLLVIFVILISIFICIFNSFPIFHLRTGISSLFGLSNVFLFKTSSGYFSPSSNLNPFTHTWSLSLEEQFYFFYPLLLWVTGYARKNERNSFKTTFLLLSLSIVSLFLFVYLYPINQNAAYFLLPFRFWEIAAGCLVFISLHENFTFNKYIFKLSSNYIFFALIGILFLPQSNAIISTFLVVLLSSLLIISIKKSDLSFKLLTKNIFLKIGLMSYSLYLWHWAIISISRLTVGIYWWTIPIQILVIYIISLLTYKYIEKPIRNFDFKNRFFSLCFGIILILFAQLIIFFLGIKGKRYLYSGNLLGIYKRNLLSRTVFFNNCNLTRKNFINVLGTKSCYSENSKKRIFIIGDSHANMFTLPFQNLVQKKYEINNFTGNGCSFPILRFKKLNPSNVCYQEMQKIESWVKDNILPGDIIFIGNARINKIFIDSYNEKQDFNFNKKVFNYINRLKDFSKSIKLKGGEVYFLVDGPRFNGVTDAYCSTEWFRPMYVVKEECYLAKKDFKKKRDYFIDLLLKESNSNYKIFYDYLDTICTEEDCYAFGYIDSDHISEDLGYEILKNSYFGRELIKYD